MSTTRENPGRSVSDPLPGRLARHRRAMFLASTAGALVGFGGGIALMQSGSVALTTATGGPFGLFFLGLFAVYLPFRAFVGVRCIEPGCAGRMFLRGHVNGGRYRCRACGLAEDFHYEGG